MILLFRRFLGLDFHLIHVQIVCIVIVNVAYVVRARSAHAPNNIEYKMMARAPHTPAECAGEIFVVFASRRK